MFYNVFPTGLGWSDNVDKLFSSSVTSTKYLLTQINPSKEAAKAKTTLTPTPAGGGPLYAEAGLAHVATTGSGSGGRGRSTQLTPQQIQEVFARASLPNPTDQAGVAADLIRQSTGTRQWGERRLRRATVAPQVQVSDTAISPQLDAFN